MKNSSELPVPLFRNQFTVESECVSGNLLFDLAPDVNFIYWEIFSDNAVVTLGIQETDTNLETIYDLVKASLYPIVVVREDLQRHIVGNITFENLRFKSMRSGLDINSSETSIAKVSFYGTPRFDLEKMVP